MSHSPAESASSSNASIRVRGARAHNLRDVDLEIPKDAVVVFTGVSGSGKSSLAFDTIFAEGQRRYVESLSSYARMFLDQVDRPDVDQIDGLSPAVAIDQKSTSRNPRSTVGTVTEIHDHLRLLWARIGVPHCVECGAVIRSQTVQQMADSLSGLTGGTRFQLLAPVVTAQKGSHAELLAQLAQDGYARALIDGAVVRLTPTPELAKTKKHSISVVVDRLVSSADGLERLTDSLETALRIGAGVVVVDLVDDPSATGSWTLAEALSCPNRHPVALSEIAPRTFSFNAPFGACTTCSGLGTRFAADPLMVLGDEQLSLREGVLLPWAQAGGSAARYFQNLLAGLATALDFSLDTPWRELPESIRAEVLNGTDTEVRVQRSNRFGRDLSYTTTFEGVSVYVQRRYLEAESETQRSRLGRYLRELPCSACNGARLRPEVLAVTIEGHSIAEVADLNLRDVASFFDGLRLDARDQDVADLLLREIRWRVRFLLEVGLDYLSLARGAASLSGGEAQRIRLATQLGAGLTGVMYVLDEPSIGLHQRDNDRLLGTIRRLQEQGNSVLVVEHDEDTIRMADWVVDVGPKAGNAGGQIVYSGPASAFTSTTGSLTADYLSGRLGFAVPDARRSPAAGKELVVVGATENNLRGIDVSFPLGLFTVVTGVSGSGKSTLVNDILSKVLANRLNGAQQAPGRHTRVTGLDQLDKLIHIDQSPIGRTPRSNPATYTGAFDRIRKLFADTNEAKSRGYQPNRFSFNVKGGRCDACSGDGTIKVEMNFLPDVYVACEVCKGTRFNRETLQVLYKGKNIAEVLDMPIADAAEFFAPFTVISRYLDALVDIGLGYVQLGQSSTTLSGGEAQRVKLATELQRRSTSRSVYILDEPTTGLHFDDVRLLLQVLQSLVDKGSTVIVIEHNLDVIKSADWVIDLGPEGGAGGGTLTAAGTPETIAAHPESWTGKYLQRALR